MSRQRKLPIPASDSSEFGRRTLLNWLGNATVLALTPELLLACGDGDRASALAHPGAAARGGAGGEGQESLVGRDNVAGGRGGASANGGAASEAEIAGAAGTANDTETSFPFSPSPVEGTLYDTWRGNTVDPQDLTALLTTWKLRVDGMVERAGSFSFAELLGLQRRDQITDFHCVEGWSVLDVPWNGIHMDALMDLVGASGAATHLTFHCFGGVYSESLPLAIARETHTLLAYGIGGKTLPLTHGFPLRLVVPRLFGYKSAKWVERVEFTDAPANGFWVERGYSYEAEVQASRLREGKY